MLQLKSSEHFLMIGKELFGNDESGDILFITETATFSAHSHLLLQHVQLLPALVCEHCRLGHEKIVIILPEVSSGAIETALKEFYLKRDSSKLNLLFNANNVKEISKEESISADTDHRPYLHSSL